MNRLTKDLNIVDSIDQVYALLRSLIQLYHLHWFSLSCLAEFSLQLEVIVITISFKVFYDIHQRFSSSIIKTHGDSSILIIEVNSIDFYSS